MKIPKICIEIDTNKFPILDGEEEELVNDGTYGKSLCLYLERTLPQVDINVPFYCCEDWGWWVEIDHENFNMGLCIYSDPHYSDPSLWFKGKNPEKYVIISSIENDKRWSWSKFKKIDVTIKVQKVMDALYRVFKEDREIVKVTQLDDYPF